MLPSLNSMPLRPLRCRLLEVLVGEHPTISEHPTIAMQKTIAYENHAFVFIVSHGTVSSFFLAVLFSFFAEAAFLACLNLPLVTLFH
jgi:hypothetical protein